MKSILIMESDRAVVDVLTQQLRRDAFEVTDSAEGSRGLAALRANAPDLLILNAVLPDFSGVEVLGEIRRDELLNRLPVLMLSEHCEEDDRILRLEMGADDIVTKPFSPREVSARVRALMWRSDTVKRFRYFLKFGSLTIDRDFKQVSVGGRVVPTSVLEFRLLSHLACNPGLIFSREQLRQLVWGSDKYVNARSIDVSIRRLREKIEKRPKHPQLLRTVYGAGYVFDPLGVTIPNV
jgi:DNA-binding response OmpR family regulator